MVRASRTFAIALCMLGVAHATTVRAQSAPAASAAPPTQVTRAFLRELADPAKLAAVIDRDAGLAYVDQATGAAAGTASPPPALLCGRALDRRVKVLARWIADAAQRPVDDGGPRCRNRPGPPVCEIGAAMEWDPEIRFEFHVDATRGLVLDAVTLLDVVIVEQRLVDDERATAARAVARLRTRTCAKSPGVRTGSPSTGTTTGGG